MVLAVRICRFPTAAKSLALSVARGTFNCTAAAATHASANAIGRPFFSQALLIRAPQSGGLGVRQLRFKAGKKTTHQIASAGTAVFHFHDVLDLRERD
jgi:hypothetical protein